MCYRHFNGDIELIDIHRETGVLVGQPINFTPTWNKTDQRWERQFLKVERKIEYSKTPSRHECDVRCYNASGRIMKCECSIIL